MLFCDTLLKCMLEKCLEPIEWLCMLLYLNHIKSSRNRGILKLSHGEIYSITHTVTMNRTGFVKDVRNIKFILEVSLLHVSLFLY